MKIARTKKQFTAENMPIEFIKEAVAIACAESNVHIYDEKDFEIQVNFNGRKPGCTTTWSDEAAERGFEKCVSTVYIRLNNGFDSFARIFDFNASIQGFFNKSEKIVCQVNTERWCNLLLENGFLEIQP